MATISHWAIEVYTNDGNGLPSSYSNSAIGLAADGVIRWVTGRPGLDGSKTVSGDTTIGVWKEALLADSFYSTFSINREINVRQAGGIQASFRFRIPVVNTSGLSFTLTDNGVYLQRCRVKVYRLTSTNGTSFTASIRAVAVIDDVESDELLMTLQCASNEKEIFAPLPGTALDDTTYPKAPKDSKDKVIPIAIGRVAHSPLRILDAGGDRTVLTRISSVDGYAAAAINPGAYNASHASGPMLRLYTLGVVFQASDGRLKGRYLQVLAGGSAQSIRIKDNAVTASDVTEVYLEAPLEVPPAFKAYVNTAQIDKDVWYFEVTRYAATAVVSEKPVYEMLKNVHGLPAVRVYDSDNKDYFDLTEIAVTSSLSNILGLGRPGFQLVAISKNEKGAASVYFPMRPLKVLGRTSVAVEGQDYPNLYDGNKSTYTDFVWPSSPDSAAFYVQFPDKLLDKKFEELYLLVDLGQAGSGINGLHLIAFIFPFDVYGRQLDYVVKNKQFTSSQNLTASFTEERMLPSVYYNEDTANPLAFYTQKKNLRISEEVLEKLRNTLAFPKLDVAITPSQNLGVGYTLRIYEIGFVAKTSINFTSEQLYCSLKGETFGTNWRDPTAPSTNRRTAADPILKHHDAMEHVIRNYCYPHPVWKATQKKIIGNKVRSTPDNGFIYTDTAAGNTGASEPTWPTVIGNTVVDGGVTWKCTDKLMLATSEFDVLDQASLNANFHIGRTLQDKKPAEEYLRELCRLGSVGLIFHRDGRIAPRQFFSIAASALDVYDVGTILNTGPMGALQPTPMSEVWTDFRVQYALSPGEDKYMRQAFVTKAWESAFPLETDPVDPGTAIAMDFVEREPSSFPGYSYQFLIATTNPHGLSPGNFVSLLGNADGFDFSVREVLAAPFDDILYVGGHLTTPSSSTTGTLRSHVDGKPLWKTYAGGFKTFARAKAAWDLARAGYVITKAVREMPEEYQECPWFPDPDETDEAGKSLWPELSGLGDDHPAILYLERMIRWNSRPKELTPVFEVAMNTFSLARSELLQQLRFQDTKVTNGVSREGVVVKVEDLPGIPGKTPDRMRMQLLLKPL